MKFESVPQTKVPRGRDGKHKEIVEVLLRDLGQLHERFGLENSSVRPARHEGECSCRVDPRHPAERDRHCDLQRQRILVCLEEQ